MVVLPPRAHLVVLPGFGGEIAWIWWGTRRIAWRDTTGLPGDFSGDSLGSYPRIRWRLSPRFGGEFAPCSTLILSGQSEIRAQLRLRSFEAVAQRITVRAHLPGLSREETQGFVRHALRQVGVERPLFTDGAVDSLHTASRGLMRPIASLATHALLDAALQGQDLVDEPNVQRAVQDIVEGGAVHV